MSVAIINPVTKLPLDREGDALVDRQGNAFPIVNGIPRVCDINNYTENFGKQWNTFRLTQIDSAEEGRTLSADRFFAETGWTEDELAGLDVLEVGSGAGRFTRVVLEHTRANLYSIDYSTAVDANLATNAEIGNGRLHLFQASITDMPFADGSFDKVFCLGVLQHTPDFEASVRALVQKAKPGGEIVVDFYPIRGWWTKLNAKYMLRPVTKRMSHDRLLSLIDSNVDWMIAASGFLNKAGLSALTRFLPLCDLRQMEMKGQTEQQLREWAVLDTFDMFSPLYDNPQRIGTVVEMFQRAGAKVTFANFVGYGSARAAVVRAVRS